MYLHVWHGDLRRQRIGNQKARVSYQQNAQGYPFCVTDMPPVRAQVSGSEVTNLVPVLMGLNFSTNGTPLFVL